MNGDREDRELVRDLVERRSEAAFRLLYRRHTPYLFALALRLAGGRREDAEDAIQESWMRAVERLDSFRFDSELRTWIAGIVLRVTRELRRKRHPEREEPRGGWELEEIAETSSSDEQPRAPAANASAIAAIAAIDVERALGELPSTLRDVVVLFELEGRSHEEIGRLLEIPAGTSKSRLWFARRALRARLGAPDSPPRSARGESR